MKKVLFLDVDGVLNGSYFQVLRDVPEGAPNHNVNKIDPVKVMMLREIIEKTGTQIVISSSWRNQKGLREALQWWLIRASIAQFVIGMTPEYSDALTALDWPNKMSMSYPRGAQIHAWMKANGTPDRYAILDDNVINWRHGYYSDDLKYLERHLVLTDWAVGMEPRHARLAINLLNEGTRRKLITL